MLRSCILLNQSRQLRQISSVMHLLILGWLLLLVYDRRLHHLDHHWIALKISLLQHRMIAHRVLQRVVILATIFHGCLNHLSMRLFFQGLPSLFFLMPGAVQVVGVLHIVDGLLHSVNISLG